VIGALVVRFSSNLTARFPVFTLYRALLAHHRYLLHLPLDLVQHVLGINGEGSGGGEEL
jgi:hypothetical protein